MQITTAMEELAELLHALSKIIRGKLDRKHIAEEIAEVQLFLWELTQIYDLQDIVDSQIEENLTDLQFRLDRSKGKVSPTPTLTNYIRIKLNHTMTDDQIIGINLSKYIDQEYR